MWFNPDKPHIVLQVNDGGANVTLNGGRSWSSILNQPTAEYYMVAVDEQYPYRLYVPQQDNTTVVAAERAHRVMGLRSPGAGLDAGLGLRDRRDLAAPDGKVIWGACKGEVGRFSVETGQEKRRWIYPQNRYGHDPEGHQVPLPATDRDHRLAARREDGLSGFARHASDDRRGGDVAGDQP